ncbi:MAG TPA: T9SS type A sorting domain-containing protein [Flavisolibacter sp.]|nr:T9SS type A sorting domain-containing protein [Flavisolibacter sp.]
MKTVIFSILFSLLLSLSFSAAKAVNYSNTGTNQAYSLSSGDTLRILEGTYSGSINNLPNGAVIIVSANARFRPSSINFWTPAGRIVNNGKVQFDYSIGVGGHFSFENNGEVAIQGDLSFYNGANKTWTNKSGSSLTVSGSISLGTNTTIQNDAKLSVGGSINLDANNSSLTNTGILFVTGNLNSNGQLNNQNTLNIAGNLNQWNGSLSNTGSIHQSGTFTISSGMTYVNQCELITKGGINNNGTFQNNGLVWAGTSNTAADQLTNSGSFINAANAKVRTATFTNYGSFTGAGFIYVTGQTTLGSNGVIGIGTSTLDTIKVYDLTRTNASNIFDNQWGTVRPNTVYRAFAEPDSIESYPGCSQAYKITAASAPLPVKWNYFHVKMLQDQPVLYWSADYEPGMLFEIQRSYDNVNFTVISNATSNNTAAYSFADAGIDRHQVAVYYRIKGVSAVDGDVKYTDTRMIRIAEAKTATLSLYPNPTRNNAAVNYKSSQTEQLIIRIKSANGQQIYMKNVVATAGSNRFELGETSQLKSGIYFVELIKGMEIIAAEKLVKQ